MKGFPKSLKNFNSKAIKAAKAFENMISIENVSKELKKKLEEVNDKLKNDSEKERDNDE